MRIAIVDDIPGEATAVKELCERWAQENRVELQAQLYPSGESFLQELRAGRFSLVFMDIYMGGINGVETARQMRRTDPKCLLVFLTSSAEHMAEAFPCHAFDYVAKPAVYERISTVLSDALTLVPDAERFLELPGAHGVRIRLSELVSAESNGNYLTISLMDGRALRRRMTFTEFTRLLDGDERFLSTIRGVVLNMDYIDDLRDATCVMTTGAVFPAKVRDGAEIEAALNRYRFGKLRTRQERGEP